VKIKGTFYNHTRELIIKFKGAGKVKFCDYSNYLHLYYRFGEKRNGYYEFSCDDRAELIRKVKDDSGLDLRFDPYPEKTSRENISATDRNEKNNSYPVSRDFILINTLQPLQLNNRQFPVNPYTSLGLYVKADEIISVEHQQIVLVENLTIMANLSALNIPASLQNALWLYRGDISPEKQTGKAYQFFRCFKRSNQLICFSDLDPDGIQIARTSGAHYWLTPEDSAVINMSVLQGPEMEWSNQLKTVKWLDNKADLPEKCQTAFSEMLNSRKTLKQEHMLAHNIKLGLYKL
jgi:hypothetical protein